MPLQAPLEEVGARGKGEVGGAEDPASPSKDKKGTSKKWLHRLTDALKRYAGKAAEALPAMAGSVVGTFLSFLGKAVGFVAEHTWALILL